MSTGRMKNIHAGFARPTLLRLVPIFTGLALVVGMVAVPAAHASEPKESFDMPSAGADKEEFALNPDVPVRINPEASSGPQVCAESPGGVETCAEIGFDGSVVGELPEVLQPGAGRQIAPQVTLEYGWNIYLYLNRGDYNYLSGLGEVALTGAVCGILAPTVIGGVACAAIAYTLFFALPDYTVPHGHCLRTVISYSGQITGMSVVQRSC